MSNRKDGFAKFKYLLTEADEEFNKQMERSEFTDEVPKKLAQVVFNTELVEQVRIDAPTAADLVTQIPLDQHLSSAS